MDNEIPNFFEDPYDDMLEKMQERIGQLFPEYQDQFRDAAFWAAAWVSHYDEAKDHPERTPPPLRDMMYGESIKNNFLLMVLIKEIKGLRKDLSNEAKS